MRVTWFAAGTALALSCSVVAQGQRSDPGAVWTHLAEKYDANGDGKVTEAEYGRGKDKFARYDRDGDGVLTDADFERGARRRGQRGGNRGNRNRGQGNRGRPSPFAMVRVEFAKQADVDRNGAVTAEEWSRYIDSLEAGEDGVLEIKDVFAGAGGGMLGRSLGRMADADRDGDITTADLERIFAAMDADENGELQRSELGELPWPGEMAPDFELPLADAEDELVTLSSFRGVKPVALIFGSYT